MYGSLYQAARPEKLATVSRPERLVPERISSHSPEARLIAILRDPVERAHSHFRMERLRETERRTFDTAIHELLRPQQWSRSRRQPTEVTAYMTNGEYGRILKPYFELFGKDRMLVCFARDLAAIPAVTLLSILRFLGVASDFRPSNLGKRYRVAGTRRRLRRLDLDRLERHTASNRHLRSAWRALPAGLRSHVDRDFKELKYQADVRNRITERQAEPPFDEIEERLRAHYALDRQQLRVLIDRDPPW